ncbi:MAG TPA: 4a-hydroxytetrahydrobiopterin dehydratase [Micromonosporaceae bacterium]|jgi:pterin-4a-carbinolamine dehydratase
MPLGREDLRDALRQLVDWVRDGRELRRTLRLDEGQHAALTERIKVVADALQVRPDIRRRDGQTQITLRTADGGPVTADEVRLAARIEDVYRSVRTRD